MMKETSNSIEPIRLRDGAKVLLICGFVLCLSNCAPGPLKKEYIKNGKRYGIIDEVFIGEWHQYYKRAISFAEGEFWEEAISDLKAAMSIRSRDKRNATTYGMHIIDYFPHREYGVILYRQGKYKESADELERSRMQSDSPRARYYLGKAAKAAIADASLQDREPPRIKITSHERRTRTNSFSILLKAEAEDDTFVKGILISGKQFHVPPAKSVSFQRYIRLSPGQNDITVQAIDIAGKKSLEEMLTVELDTSGPAVSIGQSRDAATVGKSEVIINGVAFDRSGIRSVKINNKAIEIKTAKGNPRATFSCKLLLKGEQNTVHYAVEDAMGNVTSGQIEIRAKQKQTGKKNGRSSTIRFASAERLNAQQLRVIATRRLVGGPLHGELDTTAKSTRPGIFLRTPAANLYRKAGLNGRGPYYVETASAKKPSKAHKDLGKRAGHSYRAPDISVTSPTVPDEFWDKKLPMEEFSLRIIIGAEAGLKSVRVTINDKLHEELAYHGFGKGREEPVKIDRRIPLVVGKNEVKIAVTDNQKESKTTEVTIDLNREAPSSSDFHLLLDVNVDKDPQGDICEKIEHTINSGARFRATKLQGVKVDAIVEVNARHYRGNEIGIEAEVVEGEEEGGVPLNDPDDDFKGYVDGTPEASLERVSQNLHEWLESRFPIISGKLANIQSGKASVVVYWGESVQALRAGYRFVIFRYGSKMREPVGEARIVDVDVQEKLTRGKILKQHEGWPAQMSDLVITK